MFRRSGVCFTLTVVCFWELQLPSREIHADFFPIKVSKRVRSQKKLQRVLWRLYLIMVTFLIAFDFIYRLAEIRELFLDPLTSWNENKFVERAMFIQPNRANFNPCRFNSSRGHRYWVNKGLIKLYIRPDQNVTSETSRNVKPVTAASCNVIATVLGQVIRYYERDFSLFPSFLTSYFRNNTFNFTLRNFVTWRYKLRAEVTWHSHVTYVSER